MRSSPNMALLSIQLTRRPRTRMGTCVQDARWLAARHRRWSRRHVRRGAAAAARDACLGRYKRGCNCSSRVMQHDVGNCDAVLESPRNRCVPTLDPNAALAGTYQECTRNSAWIRVRLRFRVDVGVRVRVPTRRRASGVLKKPRSRRSSSVQNATPSAARSAYSSASRPLPAHCCGRYY